LYTIRKVLKPKQTSIFKRELSQDQVINWFGFKINHSQTIFLFTISLLGLIAIIYSYFQGLDSFESGYFFRNLYTVPTYDYTSPYGNIVFQRYAFNSVHLVFFLISLYTLIKMLYSKIILSEKGINTTFQLVIFTISVVIIILLLPRLFFHIILFTALGPLVGIDPMGIEPTNLQFTDFVIIALIIFICTHSISYLIKRVPDPKEINKRLKFKSPKVLIITLSISSFIFLIIFSQSLITIFSIKSTISGFFPGLVLDLFILLLISIPFLILISYITNTCKMEENLNGFESMINKKRLGCNIRRKSYAIILFWISLTQLVYLLISCYLFYPSIYDMFNGFLNLNEFIKSLNLLILMVLEALICIFNMLKLYRTQK